MPVRKNIQIKSTIKEEKSILAHNDKDFSPVLRGTITMASSKHQIAGICEPTKWLLGSGPCDWVGSFVKLFP